MTIQQAGKWCRRAAWLCCATIPITVWQIDRPGVKVVGIIFVATGVVLLEVGRRFDPPPGGSQ